MALLMLFSKAAAKNSLAFLAGLVMALTIVTVIVLLIDPTPSEGGPSTASGWVKILIGALFLIIAWKQRSGRPRPGVAPPKAFLFGLIFAGPNPRNLGLTLPAAATISSARLSGGEQAVTVAVYVLIASIAIIVPVVAYLVLGDRATPALTRV